MKILLIIAPFKFNPRFEKPIPFGVGYLATVLDRAGHTVEMIDYYAIEMKKGALRRQLLSQKPDIVGVSSTSYSRFSAIEIINIAREVLPDCRIVAGGPHFTATAEDALDKIKALDCVVRGEGENTVLELVEAIEKNKELSGIPGISWRCQGKIRHNPDRELIQDLGTLPQLNRSLIRENLYFEKLPHSNMPCKSVVASRGCPFNCAFCFKHDRIYRRRSTRDILNEVEFLLEKFNISAIRFFDLTFTVNKETVIDFCGEILKRGLKFNWYCESRVDIDLSLLELMREAGCYSLDFGVESASPKVLKAINKGILPDQVMAFARRCHELGIKTKAFFMLSLPEESLRDAEETLDFAKKLSNYVSLVGVSVTNIIPGTLIEARAHQLGLLDKDFSWNSPMDLKKTRVFLKSEPVPLYLEKLSLSEVWELYRKYSIFEVFKVKKLSFRTLTEKLWNALTDWDKGIAFKLNWIADFFRYSFQPKIDKGEK